MNADTLPLFDAPASSPAARRRDVDTAYARLLDRMARRAGDAFREAAEAHMLRRLAEGPQTGEQLTDACKSAGIRPPDGMDDRAFGPVYRRLAASGRITQVGTALRAKGHGSAGARVWGLR